MDEPSRRVDLDPSSARDLNRLLDGMASRVAKRLETRWRRRAWLGTSALAAVAVVTTLFLIPAGAPGVRARATQAASVRTAFDDEVAPAVDASRVRRLTYVMPETGEEIPYALYLPSGYTSDREWPLLVGFMGTGLPYDFLMGFVGILDAADRHGFVLATPLGYVRGSRFGRTGIPGLDRLAERDVRNVLAIVRESYSIDAARTYLWGHSAGGVVAFDFATREPELWNGRVALLAPPDDFTGTVPADRDADGLRVLVFLGGDDTDGQAREAVGRMREAGLEPSYVELPRGDHFLWMTYDEIDPLFEFFSPNAP